MASGITHMLLAKTFNEKSLHGNDDLGFLLDEKLKLFQVGALGPDLAYSQQFPTRDLFNDEDLCSDLFHYKKTNEIALCAFKHIRSIQNSIEKDNQFAFFLGYSSHLFADGIIHPFVRDKVGNYEDAQAEHRALEMRLDAIFLNHLSTQSGSQIDINFGGLHDQIKDVSKKDLASISITFSKLLFDVYNQNIAAHRIEDWVDDLHDLFELAANKNNCYYARFPGVSSYLYNDTSKVIANQDEDLWLRNHSARGRDESFLKRDVHFLNDCIPQFYKSFKHMALMAYEYVYKNGPELTNNTIPGINLDTGRLLAHQDGKDLSQSAVLWEI